MALTNIKSYFRTRLDSLSFTEWDDAFNVSNIPANLLDKAYHIQFDNVVGDKLNGENQTAKSTIIIRLFFKGFRNPNEGNIKSIF